jgi:hypothetical protein
MPFNVARAYDEAKGIGHPVIWTAERDRDMWNNEIAPSLEVFCNDLDRVFLV